MTPSLPPREGVWFARPRPVRRTLRKIPDFVILPVGISQLFATFGGKDTPVWVGILRNVGYLLLFLMIVIWQVNELIARRTMRRDRQFSDRPVGIVEYPIEIVTLLAGDALAADRGVAWFEDGLFNFSGSATSFTLAAEDIVPRRKVGKLDPYRNLPKDSLRLVRPGESAAVRLLPLNGFRRWGFRWALRRFLTAEVDTQKARQWPPFHEYGQAPDELTPSRTAIEVGQAAARDGIAQGVIRS